MFYPNIDFIYFLMSKWYVESRMKLEFIFWLYEWERVAKFNHPLVNYYFKNIFTTKI